MIGYDLPEDGEIVIDLYQGRARVAKVLQTGARAYRLVYAVNWERLELRARIYLARMNIDLLTNATHHCPPSLALWAEWPDVSTDADV